MPTQAVIKILMYLLLTAAPGIIGLIAAIGGKAAFASLSGCATFEDGPKLTLGTLLGCCGRSPHSRHSHPEQQTIGDG